LAVRKAGGIVTEAVLLLAAGVGFLYYGSDWLVRGAARLASRYGVSPLAIGLTVVSLGTSAPEFAVGILAALGGQSDLAVGNVLGSNLANVGLILGVTALIRPLPVSSRVVRREVPIMLAVTALLWPLLLDGRLSRPEGVLLALVLVGYMGYVLRIGRAEPTAVAQEFEGFQELEVGGGRRAAADVLLVVVGGVALVIGGKAIVVGAVSIAGAMGISEVVVGLTVVAIGTSLPEMATSVAAAFKGETDIAVGNVIGSNVFNIAGVLGVSAAVEPLNISPRVLSMDLPAVAFVSVLILPLAFKGRPMGHKAGLVLLTTYCVLGFFLFRG